ncbi:MAG: hypothetical protein KJZ57_07650, partial [Anaerolineales bacterium]|nr:hypothetical protein [Anaerolineales bacterium]
MAGATPNISADYWRTLQVTSSDIEFLQTHLFERETPLTPRELVSVLVAERIRIETETAARQRDTLKPYLPREKYEVGERLDFPALKSGGRVVAVRAGVNPELGAFDVLTVEMENGTQKQFAAALENHKLNRPSAAEESASALDPEAVALDFSAELEAKV